MVVNTITDLTFSEGHFKVVGFYFVDSQAVARSVVSFSGSTEKSVPIQNIEKSDLDKKYGPRAKQAWYQFELSRDEFISQGYDSSDHFSLLDSEGNLVPLDFTAYFDRKELDKKINTFLAVSNRYAIQGNDLARALAFWELISQGVGDLNKESALVLHLYSLVAATLNGEAMHLPETRDWSQIEARCREVFKNQRMRYYFTLCRIAFAHSYEDELIVFLRGSEELVSIGQVESKLVYLVTLLKALIMRVGEGTETSIFIHTDEVGRLFKAALMNTDKEDYLTVEVAEKLSTISAIYHRIYWTKKGKDELRFGEKEFTATCRKLFIASFGALGEREINMFRQIET